MEKEDENIIITCKYGLDSQIKLYDMKDLLSNKMINYKISKIKCQLKSNVGIFGIQLYYRNLIDGKETAIINVQPKDNSPTLIEQEFDLCGEHIIDMNVWLNQDINLMGFEIITNKNRVHKFGYGNDEQLVKIPDLKSLDKIIIGFGVTVNEDNCIESIYGYYIKKNIYISNLYKGILHLREKSKNPEYNEKIQKKLSNMSKRNQMLYRICRLPQNQFFNIIKYTQ